MTKLLDVILVGAITAKTPINIKRNKDRDDRVGVPHMAKVTPGRGASDLPYIPGETLKGALRAISCDLVVRARGQKPTLDEFFALYKGGVKGDKKESSADLVRLLDYRMSNPVAGLYGVAVPSWLGGCMAVMPGLPASKDDVAISRSDGSRIDDFRLNPELLHELPEGTIDAYLAYSDIRKAKSALSLEKKGKDREIAKILGANRDGRPSPEKQAEIDALRAETAAIDVKIKALQEGTTVAATVGRTLDYKLGIAPGSRFEHSFMLFGATEVEVGLFLETLRRFSDNARLGGLRTIGYGQLSAQWAILIREDDAAPMQNGGALSIETGVFSLTSENALIQGSLDAWAKRSAEGADAFPIVTEFV